MLLSLMPDNSMSVSLASNNLYLLRRLVYGIQSFIHTKYIQHQIYNTIYRSLKHLLISIIIFSNIHPLFNIFVKNNTLLMEINDHLYHIDSNHGLNESITLPFIKYKSLNQKPMHIKLINQKHFIKIMLSINYLSIDLSFYITIHYFISYKFNNFNLNKNYLFILNKNSHSIIKNQSQSFIITFLQLYIKIQPKMLLIFQSGQIRYSWEKDKDKVSFTFQNKFGKRFLKALNIKDLFPQNFSLNYKTRKKNGNRLQVKLKIKQSINRNEKQKQQEKVICNREDIGQNNKFEFRSQTSDHNEIIVWFQKVLELDYYYFKSSAVNSEVFGHKRFQGICSQEAFRRVYPEIRCIIMIETEEQSQKKQNTKKFIDQRQEEQQFQRGDLIIYIEREKKHCIKEVIKYIETFTSQKVIYPLDDYLGDSLIKDGISKNQIINILQKCILFLRAQIESMALKTRLLIKSIDIYAPQSKRYANCQNRIGLQICLQGMFQSLPQFYFNLSYLFKLHPITIGKVQNLQFSKDITRIEKQYRQQGALIFFGSHKSVGIINLKKTFDDWIDFKRSLRKGLHIISQLYGFTREQMNILILQHRQVETFINDSQFTGFINYEYKPIDQKTFFIRCQKQNVNKFINQAFQYLKKNDRIESKRQQFTSQFELFFFNQIIKSHIQQKYPAVTFFIKQGMLYSRCKEEELEDLKIEMANEKRKFLKKIVRLPSVRSVKKSHLFNVIENEFETETFCHQSNSITLNYLFNQRINVYFRPLSSLSECHELLIPVIDKYYEEFNFFMEKFKENALSLDKYQKHLSGQYQGKSIIDRMVLYSMTKSKYVGQMLVWFIQQDERGGLESKKLKWDIGDFIHKYKNNNVLEFVIPEIMWKNEEYFGYFFLSLFKEFERQIQSCKVQTINVFYETDLRQNSYSKIQQTLKRVFQKGSNKEYFKLKSENRLTYSQIEKIIFTEGWSVNYWDYQSQKNESLSVLNSFVFAYQKMRRKDEFKVPLLLKSKRAINKYEYLLSLKQNIYYKVSSNCQIIKYQVKQNPALFKFSNTIKTYFKFLQYLVVYMDDKQTEVESKKMYFWLNNTVSVPNNEKSVPRQQKVKRFQINQEQKLIPKKNSELDIFVKKIDVVPKYIVQTHVDFLKQVKNILSVNAIND